MFRYNIKMLINLMNGIYIIKYFIFKTVKFKKYNNIIKIERSRSKSLLTCINNFRYINIYIFHTYLININ